MPREAGYLARRLPLARKKNHPSPASHTPITQSHSETEVAENPYGRGMLRPRRTPYSTVTLFAKLRG